MIKCEVIEQFTLNDYQKLSNVNKKVDTDNNFFTIGDTFECDKQMADYLTGKNAKGKTVVKILQVEPVKNDNAELLKQAYIKTTKKKNSKK